MFYKTLSGVTSGFRTSPTLGSFHSVSFQTSDKGPWVHYFGTPAFSSTAYGELTPWDCWSLLSALQTLLTYQWLKFSSGKKTSEDRQVLNLCWVGAMGVWVVSVEELCNPTRPSNDLTCRSRTCRWSNCTAEKNQERLLTPSQQFRAIFKSGNICPIWLCWGI